MPIELIVPSVAELDAALLAMREWQVDGAPVQLHPGDVGWNWRFGAEATAAAVRTCNRGGRMVALGMFDGPDLLRLALAPAAVDDDDLAAQLTAGLMADRSVSTIEARGAGALRRMLRAAGWVDDEPWTPLVRDLAHPVESCGIRVETVGAERVIDRVAVQRAAFDGSAFTAERWATMASGPAYADARCLVGYDSAGVAVATATVWSAGHGRPGLLEPMGVHRDHRGLGYGRAITRAAASALRDLGSSSVVVCTPAANAGAVSTYVSARFERLPDVTDLAKPSS